MTRRITDVERRRRLVARHHLGRTGASPLEATTDLVAVHSSDPATPYLAMWARVLDFATSDLGAALYVDRNLWRLHAMRRTLFVVPTSEAGVFGGAGGHDVAERERRRAIKWVGDALPDVDVAPWFAAVEEAVLEVLADGVPRRTTELQDAVPDLQVQVTLGSGKWSTTVPVGSRLLYLLAMDGRIVRAHPAGTWRSSQYHWVAAEPWFGHLPERVAPREACRTMAERYLAAHGPATAADLQWWTGWTKTRTQQALDDARTAPVILESGAEAFVLQSEHEPEREPPAVPTVTLLPSLDPTPMGWKERDWFLAGHEERVFDGRGNVGPTVWLDGRIVGGWSQHPDGEVVVRLLEEVSASGRQSVHDEAAGLTAWLDGTVVTPRFRTPVEQELSG